MFEVSRWVLILLEWLRIAKWDSPCFLKFKLISLEKIYFSMSTTVGIEPKSSTFSLSLLYFRYWVASLSESNQYHAPVTWSDWVNEFCKVGGSLAKIGMNIFQRIIVAPNENGKYCSNICKTIGLELMSSLCQWTMTENWLIPTVKCTLSSIWDVHIYA